VFILQCRENLRLYYIELKGRLFNVKLDRIETEAVLVIKTGKLAEIRARQFSTPKTSLDHYV